MKPFDENTPELGRIPAFVSRYWRPATANATCTICGRKFYPIIAHVMECKKSMKHYTVWYWGGKEKVIWATGLTAEEAQAAFEEIIKTFGLTAGIEEE